LEDRVPKNGKHLRKCVSCHCSDSRQGRRPWIVLPESPTPHQVQTSAGEQVKAAVFLKAHHDIWKKGEQFWDAQELPLFDRAWAFQERLLARRVVHYTPIELVWECSCSIDCECGDLQNPNTSWAEFKPGKNLKTKYSDVLVDSNMARLKFWHDICAQYSARQLMFPRDRLPALSSVARRIDFPGMGGAYLAGIRRSRHKVSGIQRVGTLNPL
jgi:hypothetical protein